jgi:hypothetical protein
MPALPPNSKSRRVGVGLSLALAVVLALWALQVWNRTTTSRVAHELLRAQPSIMAEVQADGSTTLEGSQLMRLNEAIRGRRFDRIHVGQSFITAVHETTTGSANYGTELQLRRDAIHTNTWIVSRRIAILYSSGRATKVWEYNWELGRAPSP